MMNMQAILCEGADTESSQLSILSFSSSSATSLSLRTINVLEIPQQLSLLAGRQRVLPLVLNVRGKKGDGRRSCNRAALSNIILQCHQL